MKELCYFLKELSLLLLSSFVGSKSIQKSSLGGLWEQSWELDVELDEQVTFLLLLLAVNLHQVLVIILLLCCFLDWHSFSIDNLACLWGDLLIKSHSESAAVESLKGAWSLLESINQTNLLRENQIVSKSLIVWVLCSSEFDSDIGRGKSSCLVSLFLKHNHIDVATWSNLDLLAHGFPYCGFGVMLHLILCVGDCL